jgi:hypothetical protein
MIILPYILLAAVVTILANPSMKALDEPTVANFISDLYGWGGATDSVPILGSQFVATKLLAIFLAVTLLLYPAILVFLQYVDYFGGSEWVARNSSSRAYGFALGLLGVVAFIELQPHAIRFFSVGLGEIIASWIGEPEEGNQNALTLMAAIISVLVAYLSGRGVQKATKWASKFGPWLVAILGFLAFWLIYLSLCHWALQGKAREVSQLALFLPDSLWLIAVNSLPDGALTQTASALIYYVAGGIVLWIYSFFFVDINHTSMHNIYRDLLSRAYLFSWNRKNEDDGLIHNDEQRLSNLSAVNAPYHLINAALNVSHQREAFRSSRNADFFIFSKNYIGGELTGYCRTEDMENTRPHVNLGTAMAISGAVAGASMGKATIRPLAFLLAMLNVRLNYWLPNPARVRPWLFNRVLRWAISNPLQRVGPLYLVWEMIGRLRANSMNVNLTDGGHVENLGVFELLRRECRLIIACDGERDPNLRFQGVAELRRLAQIDLSVEIEIDGLDSIRNGERHFATGIIKYPHGNIGMLVYLKSSLLQDDSLEATLPEDFHRTSTRRADNRGYDTNAYIAYYKAMNPEFPHESTADQFFDETQFECYRALGYNVANSVFRLP